MGLGGEGGGGGACVCVCVWGLPNHAVSSRLYGSFSNDDDDMKLPIFMFLEDVNTGKRFYNTCFKLRYMSLEFNSRKIHQHLIN